MRKFLISFALIMSVTSCGQTEIETPLYAQPKRRVNAQKMGSYVGPANASQVYNNPSMAPYGVPGQSLSALGQQGYQPMNINGQMSPWAYMPQPGGAGGMMPAPQPQMQMQQPMMPGGMGGMMPPQQGGYPPVEYGAPPISGGMQNYGGGMPPYQNLPQIQAPYPPQGGMMPPAQYPGGMSQNNNFPQFNAPTDITLPKLESGPYSPLKEDDYDFGEEDAEDLFGFFNAQGQPTMAQAPDIQEVENVDIMAVRLPESEQQYMDAPQLIRVDNAQQDFGNDYYQQQAMVPQHNLTTQPPRSLIYSNYRPANTVGNNSYHKNYDLNSRVANTNNRSGNYNYYTNQSAPNNTQVRKVSANYAPVTVRTQSNNVIDLGWRDAPKTLNYTPRSLKQSTLPQRVTSSTNYRPNYRYKEDYAPIRSGTYGTWYPKSMTRI